MKLKILTEKLKNELNSLTEFPEVELPSQLKESLKSLILKENGTKVSFNESSFYVETSPKHYAIIPNQYFYLAKESYDLVVILRKLFDFFDREFRLNEARKIKVNEIQDKISKNQYVDIPAQFSNVDFSSLGDEITKDDFCFLIGNLKDSKKFGSLEKNTLRASEDLLGSYILNIVPLTTAASGYFGTLVYTLSSNIELYKQVCNSIIIFHSSQISNNLSPLILYGPLGTGKTYKMQHDYIDKFAKEDRFITTFHQSFSYEEFVEGLKPVLADKPDGDTSSDVKYKIEKGIFYKACERAAELAGFASLQDCISASDRNEKMDEAIKENKIVLLCIDEINRANVSAVFGDLISLIEPSKRIGADNEMIVQLPYSKEDFAVPANLMIVGTMNTADRSIQLLDSALRRRFRFEELLPDYNEVKNSEKAKSILKAINARIRCLLDKDHQIGHSYFIEAKNDLDIFNALKDSVIPLLEEYFYNDAQKIRQILNENDNTGNAFYIKDEEAENASRLIQNDYDDEKTFYQLNPKLSAVNDEDSATSFISHIVPKSE
ncbi:MAG: AAA family ATPase [Treponemataceae bacterium]|nr:AAA family ATPase [Treponemataceae bacterium]